MTTPRKPPEPKANPGVLDDSDQNAIDRFYRDATEDDTKSLPPVPSEEARVIDELLDEATGSRDRTESLS